MTGRFEGNVALVAGGSRGIGFGIAMRLGIEGARIVVNGRKREGLDRAVGELSTAGVEVCPVAGNAGDEAVTARMVDEAVQRWGRIDHVVNNVGISPHYGA